MSSLLAATSLLMGGGAILARTGSHGSGVDFVLPLMVLIAWLILTSTLWVWALFLHTGAQYSAVECTSARVAVLRQFAFAPHPDPANFLTTSVLVLTFFAVFSKCLLNVRVR